ncbi:hypothetical protein VHEMI02487 [[Torrubiella] hemipterigena]|uniref:Enoyl-CoA hydratase/isomerase family protein n=1 Tax=[Torrubiella] hemipterigena TaxID=1531966 RepID=A0A0A1SPR3_9HYPO|nr:hypothetical protein VHEMI02487 [[Torrubiella] hemipterigena]
MRSHLLPSLLPFIGVTIATMHNFTTLETSSAKGVLTVTINNKASKVNLIGQRVLAEIETLMDEVKDDAETKIVVFQSGNPTFFSAHYDFIPRETDLYPPGDPAMKDFAGKILYKITSLRQATIAVIDGPARGIANELIVACDMRFASNKAILGSPEVMIGINTAGGGFINMARILGRARALEYALSGQDVDAFEAEKLGWINKAFHSSSDLYRHVHNLTSRIALFPSESIASIKSTINLVTKPTWDEIALNGAEYRKLAQGPEARELIGKFLKLSKNLTDVEVEKHLGDSILEIYGDESTGDAGH